MGSSCICHHKKQNNNNSNLSQKNTQRCINLAGKGTSYAEQELALEKAEMAKQNATAGSLAAKANLVKDFNERNNK